MPPLLIELITEEVCVDDDCGDCAGLSALMAEVAANGVSIGLGRSRPGPGFVVRHVHEGDLARPARDALPMLRINGRIVLQGRGWTERDVRLAVEDAQGAPVAGR